MRGLALLVLVLQVSELAWTATVPQQHPTAGNGTAHHAGGRDHVSDSPPHGIHVASWRWDEIGVFFTFTAFVVCTGLAKVAFHHAHWLSSRIPESCLMIIMGVAVGGVL
ncbi:hypothetical protein B566_EDAN013742 [Ephemera danica]|nr:hypothetical protein B566_EDAN013742 [Ephemera danica]